MTTYIKPEAIKDSSLPIEKIDNVALDLADKVNALDDSNKALFLNKINAMPATPSGDPMHWAYVTAGAEYNDTGADIVKTAPWADLIDDDYTGEYGKTVVHKAGYWYLNGLGDLTTDEIRKIYNRTTFNYFTGTQGALSPKDCKTNFIYDNGFVKATDSISLFRLTYGSAFQIIAITEPNSVIQTKSIQHLAWGNTILRHIIGIIQLNSPANVSQSIFSSEFISIKLNRLHTNFDISRASKLSVKSVLYMINNEAATSPITITLHKTVYDRCMANDAIKTALQNHTNVSLASA